MSHLDFSSVERNLLGSQTEQPGNKNSHFEEFNNIARKIDASHITSRDDPLDGGGSIDSIHEQSYGGATGLF
jgi:hypothetical protein